MTLHWGKRWFSPPAPFFSIRKKWIGWNEIQHCVGIQGMGWTKPKPKLCGRTKIPVFPSGLQEIQARHTGFNCRARIFFLCIYSESENKILKLYFLPFWAKKLITNTKVGIPIPLAALVGLLHSAVVKIVVKFTSHSQVSSAYLWCKWHQASAPRLFVDDIFWLCSQCNKIQNLSLDKDVKIVKLQIRGWL